MSTYGALTTQAAPWAFGGLFNERYRERCLATVADTLLRDDEEGRWLFTSKRGEVQRKRTVTAQALRERFVRLGLTLKGNGEGHVCVVRHADGSFKLLGEEAFAKLSNGATLLPPDPTVCALQCFVPGTYYRNSYDVVGKEGRRKTATVIVPTTPDDSKYSTRGKEGPYFQEGEGQRAVVVPHRHLRGYSKSRATRLNETLDAATLSVATYLEKTQRVRVRRLTADYIVDGQNQLWLVWLGDCTTEPALAPLDRAPTPVQKPSTAELDAGGYLDAAALEQVSGATEVVDTLGIRDRRARAAERAKGGPPAKLEESDSDWNVKFDGSRPGSTRGKFPTNFHCRGDYCAVGIHDPKQLFTEKELAAMHQSHLDHLRRAVREASALRHADPAAADYGVVAYRSIFLAGKEKRGFAPGQDTRAASEADWMQYPATPRSEAELFRPDEPDEDEAAGYDDEHPASPSAARRDRRNQRLRDGGGSQLSAPTEASANRTEWAALRGELEGGTANMYRRVKVCRHCFRMYTLLDDSREVLAKDARLEKEREKVERRGRRQKVLTFDAEPAPPSLDMAGGLRNALSQRGAAAAGGRAQELARASVESELTRESASRSSSRGGRRGAPPAPTRSWKGRLPESELYGEEVPATAMQRASSAKFEALDEYLRGSSDAAARRAEAKAAATARSRAAQADIAARDGQDPESLYFGRVLVVEARGSPDLPAAVEALEEAGFLVDVELDVKQARELLVASHAATEGAPGWQYDAVLVSDVLDMGDAFDVVGEVRTLEKAQRARESKRLAEQTKRAAMRPGGGVQDDPRLRAQTFVHLPVVVFSSRTAPEDLRAYKASGMDGCISKPLHRAALLSTMRAAVPRHGRTLLGALEAKRPPPAAGGQGGAPSGPGEPFVAFAVRIQGMAPEDLDRATENAFLAEVATQLGVGVERFRVDELLAGSLIVKLSVRGFKDDNEARAFARALRARSQLVDEERWGRHALEDVLTTVSTGAVEAVEDTRSGAQALVGGAFGTSGVTGSSAMAAKSLALPASFTAVDGSVGGVLQLDADTSLPYVVVDFSLASDGTRPPGAGEHATTFNLVVCHDFFDTFERLKIVLAPVAARYPGLQVLLWNYPGQAFTEWREEQLLNNVFMASCLSELLTHAGARGTKQFDDTRPFFLLGYGYGASVASFYATHYRQPAMRGLCLFNGFSFVDPHLAGALHDAMNVFSCAPPSRPDLPVYFWSRFLFSREYLTKVSTPLALNLYTAVHNPITLQGRMQLCIGALSSHDVRPALPLLDLPVVTVHSTQGVLVKPSHAQSWTDAENGMEPCTTIHQALKSRRTCVVWVKSGHEVFQEARKQVTILIEQLVVGYHEVNDVAFVPADFADSAKALLKAKEDEDKAPKGRALAGATQPEEGGSLKKGHGNFEDNFIDSVLDTVNKTKGRNAAENDQVWETFRDTAAQRTERSLGNRRRAQEEAENPAEKRERIKREREEALKTVLNPDNPAFERQDNVVYQMGAGSRIYPNAQDFPEVKEYMGWRLKRNKKRLQRLEYSARVIQNAFRNHLAWMVVRRLREERATTMIQRAYRGWRGRQAFLVKMRQIWAAHVIQRAWRGYAGRGFFTLLKTMHAASAQLQRTARGFLARMLVQSMQERRQRAATMMQTLWRARCARLATFELRNRAQAARTIERAYRGHLGRRRAQNERHKFLFSKSQSQGIEFGRQMLLEHKLHATRLQSEVSLLTQEKVAAEESVEALLEEISEFEQGVTQLEKEMHQLSRIEAEAVGVLDEEAKYELREQKMRLDREFGAMLAKIAERREKLGGLEGKLATLDHARQGKEEQLRTLERKLVVLLEEQQRELHKIRRRQEARGELLEDARKGDAGALALVAGGGAGGGEGAGAYAGPSMVEKKQAAQLMQSTETLMKFGFMSMSMTYFSSLNMIRAMRTVSTQDTVMAALHSAQNGGGGGGGGSGAANVPYEEKLGGEAFKPSLKPGQMPGQETLKVSAWSVDDVARWLQTLSLGQYREAFVDAAVDGAFLYDLDDDDLRNTLGIEHRLHRKKILNMTNKLKASETERNKQMRIFMQTGQTGTQVGATPLDTYARSAPEGSGAVVPAGGQQQDVAAAEPVLVFEEVLALVRHGKVSKLKDALASLPSKRFDAAIVKVPYVEDFGTAYVDAYERETFNLNKVNEHGNTMLHVAAQNGNEKIAKILVQKGGNVNHQNKAGQTAGHYANAYQFYDFLSWLYDPEGGGADDTIENMYGLGPYDGLAVELENG